MRVESAERLPDGRWAVNIVCGDQRKSTNSLWVKRLERVDVSKTNGYAFEGEFIRTSGKYHETTVVLAAGEAVVYTRQVGSWKHPATELHLLVAKEDGIYKEAWSWDTKADKAKAVHEVAVILEHEGIGQPATVLERIRAAIEGLERTYGVEIEYTVRAPQE